MGTTRSILICCRDENLAGDVNGDKIIDIKDAEIIANNYGKKGVSVKDGDLE